MSPRAGLGGVGGGEAWFDDLTITSEPFLSLERVGGGTMVTPGGRPKVRVTLSGVPTGAAAPALSVAVRNADDPTAPAIPAPLDVVRLGTAMTGEVELDPLPRGLWEVTAAVATGPAGDSAASRTRTLRIASADPRDLPIRGAAGTSRFGWTLAAAPGSGADAWADAAAAAGAGWVRWTAGDPAADERLAAAVRAKQLRPAVRVTAATFGGPDDAATADALASWPDPAGELGRLAKPLAVHVRHWQIGVDREPLAVGGPFAPTAAGLLRAAAPGVVTVGPASTGAGVRLSVGTETGPPSAWRVTPAADDPHEFLWGLIEAAAAGAGPVFAADATDGNAGLLDTNGSPTRRFLPFRTAAALLGESEFLGRVRLPGVDSREEPQALAFRTPVGPVLAVRGFSIEAAPTSTVASTTVASTTVASTTVRLGGTPVLRNTLGSSSVPASAEEGRDRIEWSAEPRFYTGLSERLLRVRLGTTLDRGGVLRSTSEPQTLSVRVRNPDAAATTLTVAPEAPAGWEITPKQADLTLPGGGDGAVTFALTLPTNVSLGPHPVTVRLTLHDRRADRPNGDDADTLRIPRTARVRLAGLRLDVTDRRLPGGGWEVIQTLTNELGDGSSPAFECDVLVPGAARVSRRTNSLDAGSHRLTHRLPAGINPGEAVWLRCSEIGGDRVLNRRWTLGDPPPPSAPPTAPPSVDSSIPDAIW